MIDPAWLLFGSSALGVCFGGAVTWRVSEWKLDQFIERVNDLYKWKDDHEKVENGRHERVVERLAIGETKTFNLETQVAGIHKRRATD